jgi:hypothetical protein
MNPVPLSLGRAILFGTGVDAVGWSGVILAEAVWLGKCERVGQERAVG